jgi:hypothetical protein
MKLAAPVETLEYLGGAVIVQIVNVNKNHGDEYLKISIRARGQKLDAVQLQSPRLRLIATELPQTTEQLDLG